MDYTENIKNRIRMLGSLRVLTLNNLIDAFWSEGSMELNEMTKNLEGFCIICNTLGIKPDMDLVYGGSTDWENVISGFLEVLITKDKLAKDIREKYGNNIAFLFVVTQFLLLIRITASSLMRLKLKNIPKKRLPYILEEQDKGFIAIEQIGEFLEEPSNNKTISELWSHGFSKQIYELCGVIKTKKHTAAWAKRVHDSTDQIINDLVPEYGEIEERIGRAEKLIKDLEQCKTGPKQWRQYEDICARILQFLFIPPFTQIKLQARSGGNHERRDAILPNNLHLGFWNLIRDEFNSRHIVCEFKNSQSRGTKEWLNQLRIYLSKPTIGRFGILFTRRPPSKSLLQAQRDAYEQAGILILIIDDVKMQKLIKYKCYLDEPEIYLENEKIEFEIEY